MKTNTSSAATDPRGLDGLVPAEGASSLHRPSPPFAGDGSTSPVAAGRFSALPSGSSGSADPSLTAALPLFEPRPEKPLKARFDGPAYSPGEDDVRLTEQIARVFNALNGKGWKTVAEIAAETGDPEPSVSAQLRHLRKPRFGGWNVERRKRESGKHLHEYAIHGRMVETGRKDRLLEAVLAELADLRATVQRLEKQVGK